MMHLKLAVTIFLVAGLFVPPTVIANDSTFELKLSGGSVWQSSNEVQIPNNDDGTRFSLKGIAGAGPWAAARIEAIWGWNQKHALRVMLAPLSYSEPGSISQEVRYAGVTYSLGQPVQADYRFNSWRLGYRYHWITGQKWNLWVGGTLKVRDAEITLKQSQNSSTDDDLGVVPLLYLASEFHLGNRWTMNADLDGLAGGPGRAIDLGVSLNYQVSKHWRFGVEYRTLEGGADIDELYNFAWFNSALVSIRYHR